MSVFHGPVSFRLNNAKIPGKLAAVNMMIKFFLPQGVYSVFLADLLPASFIDKFSHVDSLPLF